MKYPWVDLTSVCAADMKRIPGAPALDTVHGNDAARGPVRGLEALLQHRGFQLLESGVEGGVDSE